MGSNKPDKSLLSGSTTLLLLQLLSEREMYGYEMIETLRDRSQNVFELRAGTLYPLLHGLEEKGFLESYEKEEGKKTSDHVAGNGDFLSAVVFFWKVHGRIFLQAISALAAFFYI